MLACKQCGKELTGIIWPGRKYCDNACKGAAKTASGVATLPCAHCGQVMQIERWRLKARPSPTCGYACAHAKRGRGKKSLVCSECSQEFSRRASEADLYTKPFCSLNCKRVYQQKHPREVARKPWLQKTYACAFCQKPVIRTPAMIAGLVFCGHKCCGRYFSGPNAPAWKNGASVTPYGPEFTRWLKYKIRKRDEFKCRICSGTHNRPYPLHVHHYDEDKTNNSDGNLITLCQSCHSRVHGKSLSCPEPIKTQIH